MDKVQWGSLPQSLRLAAVAFAVHALLLVLDLIFFGGAYGGNRPHDPFWARVRILAMVLCSCSLLLRNSRPWLIGLIACSAFLIHDVMKLRDIFAGPPLEAAQRQLTAGLFMSLLVGIGGSFASSVTTLLRKPAA